jgi:hypothetical protein
LQHSIACSGVVMPPQSNAYAIKAKASTVTKIVLLNRIATKLDPITNRVKRVKPKRRP